ncbi:MAG: membrane associated rhomboid family serine protease [Hyphomicrobiaceae bacterium]|jgi:membrane associated rhomboid family serine protease
MRLGPSGPIPAAVRALIIANVAVYVLQVVVGRGLIDAFALVPAEVGHFELWRLVTYQFLHGGVWHLALNMLMLWMFGSELEQRWGERFFLKYYFVCGIGGGLLFTLVRWATFVPSVGASGAIYGILMAYGMWFPNRELYVFLLFPVKAKHLVLFFMALEFLQTLESSGTGIAHAAHLGGMLFGYAYLRWWGVSGFAIPKRRDLELAWRRWRLRRLQRKHFGPKGGGPGDRGPTVH